ncbi:MAG: lipocalin family protein [Bacteroidales bacterium]|jgi:lipocalin
MIRLKTIFITLPVVVFLICTGCFEDTPYISYRDTITHMDLELFLGTWHEVAQIGKSEKEHIAQTVYRSYSDPKGSLHLMVESRKYTVYGPLQSKKGMLKWNEDLPGVLKISFLLNFYQEYYVLYLADDYSVCSRPLKSI